MYSPDRQYNTNRFHSTKDHSQPIEGGQHVIEYKSEETVQKYLQF